MAWKITSIRVVERVTGHHRDTVSRYYRLIGEHTGLLNDYQLRNVQSGRIERDEIRMVIQKTNIVIILARKALETFWVL